MILQISGSYRVLGAIPKEPPGQQTGKRVGKSGRCSHRLPWLPPHPASSPRIRGCTGRPHARGRMPQRRPAHGRVVQAAEGGGREHGRDCLHPQTAQGGGGAENGRDCLHPRQRRTRVAHRDATEGNAPTLLAHTVRPTSLYLDMRTNRSGSRDPWAPSTR